MKHTPTKQNFKYPEIKKENYRFGSGQLVGTPLRLNGDWRASLPPEEFQNIRGIESSACYIEAQQHTIATILEEAFSIIDENYSSRFNALLSDGSENGGDPIKGAQSIRHDGLIPDSILPFGEEIESWNDFHSYKGASEVECVREGQRWLKKWTPKYDIVFERNEPLSFKYMRLRDALKFSPVCASVTAWYEENEMYIKPEGMRDNHLIEIVYLDDNNCAYVRDTYAPFIKKLAPFYNFDFGLRWTIDKTVFKKKENWLTDLIRRLLSWFK